MTLAHIPIHNVLKGPSHVCLCLLWSIQLWGRILSSQAHTCWHHQQWIPVCWSKKTKNFGTTHSSQFRTFFCRHAKLFGTKFDQCPCCNSETFTKTYCNIFDTREKKQTMTFLSRILFQTQACIRILSWVGKNTWDTWGCSSSWQGRCVISHLW
jgi:hypothetical protein